MCSLPQGEDGNREVEKVKFKYELGQVLTTTTGEECGVLGRAEYSDKPNMYLLSWPSDAGSRAEIWFEEAELSPVVSMPEPGIS